MVATHTNALRGASLEIPRVWMLPGHKVPSINNHKFYSENHLVLYKNVMLISMHWLEKHLAFFPSSSHTDTTHIIAVIIVWRIVCVFAVDRAVGIFKDKVDIFGTTCRHAEKSFW